MSERAMRQEWKGWSGKGTWRRRGNGEAEERGGKVLKSGGRERCGRGGGRVPGGGRLERAVCAGRVARSGVYQVSLPRSVCHIRVPGAHPAPSRALTRSNPLPIRSPKAGRVNETRHVLPPRLRLPPSSSRITRVLSREQNMSLAKSWFDNAFPSRLRAEQLLRPDLESGLLSQHDFNLAVAFLPGYHRYLPVCPSLYQARPHIEYR